MSKKLTQEEVVAQFEAIENIKKKGYTFKNLIYVNNNTKVSVTCPVKDHGDFSIKPANFKAGQGCNKCAIISRAQKNILTQEEVVAQFEAIEKIKKRGYTFKNLKYVSDNTKVLVTCPIHKDFPIKPNSFKNGCGCRKCFHESKINKEKDILIQFEAIEKIKKRGYTFQNLKYVHSKAKVLVTCPIHKDFEVRVDSFKNGCGCINCAISKKKTQEEVITKFQEIEQIKKRGYTFKNLKYVNNKTKVLITCPYHEDFLASPAQFMKGHGCPTCAKCGFKKDKPAIFYYVRINKDGCEAYKPGITNHTVKQRYKKDFEFMTIIRIIEFESGQEAYDFEQSVLNDYAYAKWDNIPLLRSGNTELMKYDILDWDN